MRRCTRMQSKMRSRELILGTKNFSIFTTTCYLRWEDGELINENISITSEANNHSRTNAYACTKKVIDQVRDKHNELFSANMKLHIWSDGCDRSRFVFALKTHFDKSFQLAWYYKQRHHGKGAMDGVGGTVKNKVFRDFKSFKVQITSPQCFANYADKVIHEIQCVHIPMDEIMEQQADVANGPTIDGTLWIHMVKRVYNEDDICKLEFFETFADTESFHDQWY